MSLFRQGIFCNRSLPIIANVSCSKVLAKDGEVEPGKWKEYGKGGLGTVEPQEDKLSAPAVMGCSRDVSCINGAHNGNRCQYLPSAQQQWDLVSDLSPLSDWPEGTQTYRKTLQNSKFEKAT